MEKENPPQQDDSAQEVEKPIVFPEGSIELDHSSITLTTCSSVVRFRIHHEPGFFYEVYLRDSEPIYCD